MEPSGNRNSFVALGWPHFVLHFGAFEHYCTAHARNNVQNLIVEIESQFTASFYRYLTIEIGYNSENALVTKSIVKILLYGIHVS